MLDIKEGIKEFIKKRDQFDRYASFDYCYNYFYSFKDNPLELANEKNLETSCFQLGFYLASWGMMRGSSFLLNKSVKYFEPLIIKISQMPRQLYNIDISNYNVDNIKLLFECKNEIYSFFGKDNKPSDTLISKIMLGVFANVPAYDRFFKDFLRENKLSQSFSKKSLEQLNRYYLDHKDVFDEFNIPTLQFNNNSNNPIYYSKAKLLDMYGFISGLKKSD